MRSILKREQCRLLPQVTESCDRHRAGSDTTTSCLIRGIIGVRCTTHQHRPGHGHERRSSSKQRGNTTMGTSRWRGTVATVAVQGHPSPWGSDGRRRITAKREPREVRVEQSSTTEKHVPRRLFVKTIPQGTCSCRHHAGGTGRVR